MNKAPMVANSLFEKVSQLLFPRIGSNMNPAISVAQDAERVESLIEKCPVGGLVLFNGTLSSTPEVLVRLQSKSTIPLLVCTDMERGLGQQLAGATVFPHAFAFDALGPESIPAIERSTGIAAREALACGVHVSFSPVADIHSNPDNPIISIRSYGSRAEEVSERVRAYIRVCKEKGLLCTAKHFPGHGDTSTDSHETVPVVARSRAELMEQELSPFRAAIAEGVDMIMTAHVSYPGLDERGTVATRSAPILTDLLRDELKFDGVVITDSLLMEGAGSPDINWEARMVSAGVDVLLDVPDPENSARNLVRAVDEGAISEERIDASVTRIQTLKDRMVERFGSDFFVDPSGGGKRHLVGSEDHKNVALNIAEKAVQVVVGSPYDVPFTRSSLEERGLLVVFVRPHTTYSDPTAASLEEFVGERFSRFTFREISPETTEEQYSDLSRSANQFGGILVAAVVKPAAWHRFGLLERQAAFVQKLSEENPIVLAALGSARVLDHFPRVALGLCTFSDVAASNQALISFFYSLLKQG